MNQDLEQEETFNWLALIEDGPIKLNMPRSVEVILFNMLHGHFPGNKFLWNLSQVPSPLCECKTEMETADHIIFRCNKYTEQRATIISESDSWLLTKNLIDKDPKNRNTINKFKHELKKLLEHILKHRFKSEIRLKKYMLVQEDSAHA